MKAASHRTVQRCEGLTVVAAKVSQRKSVLADCHRCEVTAC